MSPISQSVIDFRQFLKCCERIAHHCEDEWQSFRFSLYLDDLRQKFCRLEQYLEQNEEDTLLTPEIMTEFARKINFLESLQRKNDLSASTVAHISGQASTIQEQNEESLLRHQAAQVGSKREELLNSPNLEKKELFKRTAIPKKEAPNLNTTSLESFEEEQSSLTNSLLHMTGELKHGVQYMHNRIKDDTKSLEKVGELAEKNSDKVLAEQHKLSELIASVRSNLCGQFFWTIILVIVFIIMMIISRMIPPAKREL
eukprot:TRINITY_DN758069_c1_g1_i1.p1 TRINITY_DN758069_c1_g1~~TRINITY_DN758069_c1_g1_i1.p1  ORF type:complete len:256 (+),score=45.48 TRINITY_DN758069_c1_g1_i1:126-893(+)